MNRTLGILGISLVLLFCCGVQAQPIPRPSDKLDPFPRPQTTCNSGPVPNVRFETKATYVHLDWDPVPGAASYIVHRVALSEPNATPVRVAPTGYSNTEFWDAVPDPRPSYQYSVTEIQTNGCYGYVTVTAHGPFATPNPSSSVGKRLSPTLGEITWLPIFGAYQYRVYGPGLPNTGLVLGNSTFVPGPTPAPSFDFGGDLSFVAGHLVLQIATPSTAEFTYNIFAVYPGNFADYYHPATAVVPSGLGLFELLRRPRPSITTQRMDNGRTGVNDREYVLTPQAITSGLFHKLYTFPVDGQIYSQPLYIPQVLWPDGSYRNLVIVTTTKNTVFEFDADGPNNGKGTAAVSTISLGTPLPANYMPMAYTEGGVCPWEVPPTAVAPSSDGYPYNLAPLIGIVSTPVVDPTSNTLFVTAVSVDNTGTITYKLHALSLGSQLVERAGSPITIAGSVPSQQGAGAASGKLTFDPRMHLQRAALLLNQGRVFIGFASHTDTAPYHGWLFEYDAASLRQIRATALNVNSDGAGIWQAGSGPVGMPDGSAVVMTGNSGNRGCAGEGNIIDPPDQENSFLRFLPNGTVLKFQHPDNVSLNSDDLDLGSSGPVLLSGTTLVAGAGKDAKLFVVDTASMQSVGQLLVSSSHEEAWNVFVRAFGGGWPHVHGTPVAWQIGLNRYRLFVWPEHSPLTAIDIDTSTATAPNITILQKGPMAPDNSMPGGLPSLSVHNDIQSTALLWTTIPLQGDALSHNNVAGALRVFRATDIISEIWNSNNPTDALGTFSKNPPPFVADGLVYVATFDNALAVYGMTQWATLIADSSHNGTRSQLVGQTLTDLVSVQNTGARAWSIAAGDRLQVNILDATTNEVLTRSEATLPYDVPWNGIVQIDVSVPTPMTAGNFLVRGQMITGTSTPFGEIFQLGRLDLH